MKGKRGTIPAITTKNAKKGVEELEKHALQMGGVKRHSLGVVLLKLLTFAFNR